MEAHNGRGRRDFSVGASYPRTGRINTVAQQASISSGDGSAESTPPTPESGPLLSPLRELQLVEAFRSGDPDAVGTLLRAYQKRMYAVCYRMLRNDDEARDLTQESMVRVLEGLASYDARARLSTWIIRVTMNCCLSYLRKRKLRRHLSLDRPVEGSSEGGTYASQLAQLPNRRELASTPGVELEETRSLVLRGLETLDPDMRAVLVLRDMHDLDYQQISEVIESPIGTVKSRLFRARAALREAIELIVGGQGDPGVGSGE